MNLENRHGFFLLLLTFLPAAAALAVALFQPRENDRLSRWYALASSIVGFFVATVFLLNARGAEPGEWFAFYRHDWAPELGVSFALGMDGLSAALVFLTNLLTIVAILASWTAIEERRREFHVFLLVLQTGVIGTFLALDLFLFYVFWEVMLVPLYLLIGIFGSKNRIHATMKFFLYTFAGSVVMLVGIMVLYFEAAKFLPGGRGTFFLPDLLGVAPKLGDELAGLLFLAFLVAFAIKIPMFPFHTWLPDAHTEAPTAGSILLAGVLLKTGVYGLMRIAIPLFPEAAAAWAPTIVALGVVGIVYGALAAIAQEDMKRLVAYSSVSHMGFIVVGLFSGDAIGTTGAAMQMVNHGISTGALFFCVGALYERRHTRLLSEFGGIARNMRVFTVLTVIVVLSSVGLPGLNGFVGEFLILLGAFRNFPVAAGIGTLGVILGAVYLLRMTQATFFGPLDRAENRAMKDANLREIFCLGLLIFFAVRLGLFPQATLSLMEPASRAVATAIRPEGAGTSGDSAPARDPDPSPNVAMADGVVLPR